MRESKASSSMKREEKKRRENLRFCDFSSVLRVLYMPIDDDFVCFSPYSTSNNENVSSLFFFRSFFLLLFFGFLDIVPQICKWVYIYIHSNGVSWTLSFSILILPIWFFPPLVWFFLLTSRVPSSFQVYRNTVSSNQNE